MIEDFDHFVQWLRLRLKDPLPGATAQNRMMPLSIDGKRVNFKPANKPRLGSVLVLLYPRNNEVYLPLMKRPEYDGVHSGQVSFPGGKMEDHDVSLIDTALREGEEEVGIIGQDVELIGNLSEHFIAASNFRVSPVVGSLSYEPTFIPDEIEVDEVLEVSLNYLLDDANIKQRNLLVRNRYSIETPYYDVFGHVVWGATAMMLSEFLTMIKTDYIQQS